MKVLHISETLKGGIESYLQELTSLQSQRGYDVNVISQDNNLEHVNKVCFKKKGRISNVLSLFWLTTLFIIKARPNVIHVHSSFAGVLRPYIYLLSKLTFLKSTIVYCSHGWSFFISNNRFFIYLLKKIEFIFSFFCHSVICISTDEYNMGLDIGIKESKLKLIFNGVSDALDANKLNGYFNNATQVKIVFVGRFDKQKGIDVLLEAFSKCKRNDIHLEIVGEPVIDDMSSLKERYSQDTRITWHGWLNRQDVLKLYGKATATIIPSRWEGFGLVAIESLRSGTPIICSAVGGLLDICENGVNGYSFQLSVDGLTEVLNSLDKKSIAVMRDNARRSFLSRFTADEMFKKTMLLYEGKDAVDSFDDSIIIKN